MTFSVVYFCHRGYDCPGRTSARHDARIRDSIPFRDFGCATSATLLKVVQLESRMDEHDRKVAGSCRPGGSGVRRRCRHCRTRGVRRRRERPRRPTTTQIRAVVCRFHQQQWIYDTRGQRPAVTDVADRTRNHGTAAAARDDNDDAAVSDAVHTATDNSADEQARGGRPRRVATARPSRNRPRHRRGRAGDRRCRRRCARWQSAG